MKSFKQFVNEASGRTLILVKPAKNDQEIFNRLKELEDAGIQYADSGSRNPKTDIIVGDADATKAKSILKSILVKS